MIRITRITTLCVAAQTGDPIEQVYRSVDARLAEIVDAAGPETTVVVFSLLGMTANYSGEHLLDEILARIERRSAGPTLGHKPSRGSERRFPSGFDELRPRRCDESPRNCVRASCEPDGSACDLSIWRRVRSA